MKSIAIVLAHPEILATSSHLLNQPSEVFTMLHRQRADVAAPRSEAALLGPLAV